ncbi:short-chain dehydrogenase [Planoprotostelium fungivorum]|uniref:Short-chain dehydrogenase n=1 Tax=Planoprotostelium fungivorum TaxID=1890364 RepID=A0A2P6NKY2_9EUKA|nr:short-chain dehydrogenase [Planoprotostelium fungivorum]
MVIAHVSTMDPARSYKTNMSDHPAFTSGNVAVITGGANGIGLACAKLFAKFGLKVVVADANEEQLKKASEELSQLTKEYRTIRTDVSKLPEVQKLKDEVYSTFGEVHILMNNAGIGGKGSSLLDGDIENFQNVLNVNTFGIVHGVQVFAPAMIAQGKPALIINTGSKQGITCPPGNASYNVSKAAVKMVTEHLSWELRQKSDCKVTAHLLIPGWTFTGMTGSGEGKKKPDGAWTSDQVARFMVESVNRGDFYILCPDNSVDRQTDELRIEWTANDIIKNRPALSRWHPDHSKDFEKFVKSKKENTFFTSTAMTFFIVSISELRGFNVNKTLHAVVSLDDVSHKTSSIPKGNGILWHHQFRFDITKGPKQFKTEMVDSTTSEVVSSMRLAFDSIGADLSRSPFVENWFSFPGIEGHMPLGEVRISFEMSARSSSVSRATSPLMPASPKMSNADLSPAELEKMNLNPAMKKILTDLHERNKTFPKIQFEHDSMHSSPEQSDTDTLSEMSYSRRQSVYTNVNSPSPSHSKSRRGTIDVLADSSLSTSMKSGVHSPTLTTFEKKKALEGLVRALWSTDPVQTNEAVAELTSTVLESVARNIFIEVKGPQMLAAYLDAYHESLKDETTLLRVVWILASFSNHPAATPECIVPLIRIIASTTSGEIQSQCIWALCNWSSRDQGARDIKKIADIGFLLRLMFSAFERAFSNDLKKEDHENLLLYLLRIFINVTAEGDAQDIPTREDELVTLMVVSHLGNCERLEIAYHILWLLSHLTLSGPGQMNLLKSGSAAAIPKIVASYSPSANLVVLRLILKAISCLANVARYDQMVTSIEESDCMPILMKILTTPLTSNAQISWSLKEEASRAIAALSQNERHRDKMISSSVHKALADYILSAECMEEQSIKIKTNCMWALTTLLDNAAAADAVADSLMIILSSTLFPQRSHLVDDRPLRSAACWLINTLCRHPTHHEWLIGSIQHIQQVIFCLRSGDERLSPAAARALISLGKDEKSLQNQFRLMPASYPSDRGGLRLGRCRRRRVLALRWGQSGHSAEGLLNEISKTPTSGENAVCSDQRQARNEDGREHQQRRDTRIMPSNLVTSVAVECLAVDVKERIMEVKKTITKRPVARRLFGTQPIDGAKLLASLQKENEESAQRFFERYQIVLGTNRAVALHVNV